MIIHRVFYFYFYIIEVGNAVDDNDDTRSIIQQNDASIFCDVPRKKRTPRIVVEEIRYRSSGMMGAENFILVYDVESGSIRGKEETTAAVAVNTGDGGREHSQAKIPKPAHCAVCDIYFRLDAHYKSHYVQKHARLKAYQCDHCRKSYHERRNLYRHFRLKHPDIAAAAAVVVCPICHGELPNDAALQLHGYGDHPSDKVFRCRFCPEAFRERAVFKKHVNEEHAMKYLTCQYCKFKFLTSDEISTHICKEICWNRSPLPTLRGDEGNTNVSVNEVLTAAKTRSAHQRTYCDDCGIDLEFKNVYLKHMRVWHQEKKMYKCNMCSSAFTYKCGLVRHRKIQHDIEDNCKKYACMWCTANIKGVLAYEKHGAKHHPGWKLFRCGECSLKFFRKCHLVRHVKIKHGSARGGFGSFQCDVCHKKYSLAFRLRQHRKTCAAAVKGMKFNGMEENF